jgi:hypothetical protein
MAATPPIGIGRRTVTADSHPRGGPAVPSPRAAQLEAGGAGRLWAVALQGY